jgi:tetratricopeptide (TPR) repeat protein
MMTPYEKAVHYEHAGEYEKAFDLFRHCLSEDGHDKGTLNFHCGWCLENIRDGDRNRAVRFYEKASGEAESVLVRVNSSFRAGWIQLQDKEQEKAADAFRNAIDLSVQVNLDHELYHHAVFWYAMCLEHQGRYLEATHQYSVAQRLSATLAPESCYRMIVCCNQVGKFEDALKACGTFPVHVPAGYDPLRYAELAAVVRREETLLLRCLSADNQPAIEGSQ